LKNCHIGCMNWLGAWILWFTFYSVDFIFLYIPFAVTFHSHFLSILLHSILSIPFVSFPFVSFPICKPLTSKYFSFKKVRLLSSHARSFPFWTRTILIWLSFSLSNLFVSFTYFDSCHYGLFKTTKVSRRYLRWTPHY